LYDPKKPNHPVGREKKAEPRNILPMGALKKTVVS